MIIACCNNFYLVKNKNMSEEKEYERKVFLPQNREGEICIEVEGESSTDSTKSNRSVDVERKEEQWTERSENYLKRIKDECQHKANVHSVISHKSKKYYQLTALPITILPLILVNIDYFAPQQKEVQTAGLTLVSILSGINTLYNWSKKCEAHNTAAGKYADLCVEIEKILVRGKAYRQAWDVTLEKISTKYRELDSAAPYV